LQRYFLWISAQAEGAGHHKKKGGWKKFGRKQLKQAQDWTDKGKVLGR